MTCGQEQVRNGTSPTATGLLRVMPLGVVLLLVAPGCQSTKGQYDVRMWADVNTLGSPAAFIDQSRRSGFRPEPPVNTSAIPESVRIETGSSGIAGEAYQTFPVFSAMSPTSDSGCLQQGTGSVSTHDGEERGSLRQPMSHTDGNIGNRLANTQKKQEVVPPEAWLF